jgi:hypothetical protein
MIDTSELAFPKPGDYESPDVIIHVFPDGREVIRVAAVHGRAIYRQRIIAMAERQRWICCLEGYAPMCRGRMNRREISFEHEWGRGGGKRDDRIILPDGTWINGAAHKICNQWKGSRYIDYNRTIQRLAHAAQCR